LIVSDTFEVLDNVRSAVTIGTFDGVHIGHQKIIKHLVARAHSKGLKSIVLTFFPHPRMVLSKENDIELLNTIKEKSKLLENLGIDYLIVLPFTKEFSVQSAQEFVQHILVDGLHVAHLVVGYDHRFGKNREANVDDLIKFGTEFDFQVEQIEAQDMAEVTISSTKIRIALKQGKVALAAKYLGYHYAFMGTVIHGQALGRQMGFPTANLHPDKPYKLIPHRGVYAVRVKWNNNLYPGMMNIGINPTVSDDGMSIEVHLFDFNGNLYHEEIEVQCIERLRDEIKFKDVAALKKQLIEDKNLALAILKK
jgi:riboflavin kinase/FMN adenylyltransferase